MLRVVIASDSFKGSLTSAEVARSIVSGLRSVIPDCECIELSIADGGEGTADALMALAVFRLPFPVSASTALSRA